MEFVHKPVLLNECIEYLNIKPEGVYIDATAGGAGHASEIYRRLNEKGTLIAIDQDSYAIEVSGNRLKSLEQKARLILENTNFINIREVCEKNCIISAEGVLMDLGVSSYQLDNAERGFSYQKDSPLDMRMDRNSSLTAETVVNEYSQEELRDVIQNYGEEKWAARIAQFIVDRRKKGKIKTTGELVDIIKAAIPSSARREGPHPAKRTFQAIRIEVNNELGILNTAIDNALSILNPGGRLCIITFHSLEDRIVKNAFQKKQKPCTCPPEFPACICGKKKEGTIITRKPVIPSEEEVKENPRARSAKLRVIEKA